MARISLHDFYMGRDARYADELTPRIRSEAALTVERVNAMLVAYEAATGDDSDRKVNSGWRPVAVQLRVNPNAPKSKHTLGQAVDLSDEDGTLDAWCESEEGLKELERIGLWLESPAYTPRWAHLQTVAPGSGRRVFIP